MKRCVFVSDVPGWAFDRTGQALVKYGQTKDHSWEVLYVNPYMIPIDGFAQYDIVRVGGVPLFIDLAGRKLVNERKFFPTVASFWDLQVHGDNLAYYRQFIAGIIINDQRFRVPAIVYDRPVIYSPDKVDHQIFYPNPQSRRLPGPVRVGWAGSEKWWQGIKRVKELCSIVKRAGGLFVCQDREVNKVKTALQMSDWFNNDIDIYACANIERTCTPVPVLEALACCCPVITTRCGELDGILSTHLLCDDIGQLDKVLSVFLTNQAAFAALQAEAVSLLPRWFRFLTWEGSQEAKYTTAAMLSLMSAIGGS
jgi:glycosyltransferase involved in cell wall biosynthesis